MVQQKCLSDNDRAVLDAIFSPSEIGGEISQLQYDADGDLPQDLQDPQTEQTVDTIESVRIEATAVAAAESKDYDRAVQAFDRAIALDPNRATLFNNRAQTYRLMGNDDAALADLEHALRLSNSGGRSGCKALCQRGLLRRKVKNVDGAKEDFSAAARLGSKFARNQLVELNPYAALCNQMLREAFDKLA